MNFSIVILLLLISSVFSWRKGGENRESYCRHIKSKKCVLNMQFGERTQYQPVSCQYDRCAQGTYCDRSARCKAEAAAISRMG